MPCTAKTRPCAAGGRCVCQIARFALIINGHPSGGPWRQWSCRSGHGSFLEPYGTLCPGKRPSVALRVRGLACLAEGLGMRATARVCAGAPHTGRHWLVEAAEQLQTSLIVDCRVVGLDDVVS